MVRGNWTPAEGELYQAKINMTDVQSLRWSYGNNVLINNYRMMGMYTYLL